MNGMLHLSDVEKLKILKSIRIGYSNCADFEKYIDDHISDINIERSEILRRLDGYFLEDEFSLLCHLMECCSSVTPLGQNPATSPALKTPDFLVAFKTKNGEIPCFVEVKTTANFETKPISSSMLTAYKNFAEKFKLPIFFASRITLGNSFLWILQSENEFIENKRKTKIDNYTTTCGYALLNDYALTIKFPFKLEMTFSPDDPTQKKPLFDEFGYLTSLSILIKAPSTTLSTSSELSISVDDLIPVSFLIHELGERIEVRRSKFATTVIKEFAPPKMVWLSSLVVQSNKKIGYSENGTTELNASRFLAMIEKGLDFYVKRSNLLFAMEFFNNKMRDNGLPEILGLGDFGKPGDRAKHLKRLTKIR